MEPEGSLLHSQVPATCPCPEPARSIPYPHIPRPEDPTNTYCSDHKLSPWSRVFSWESNQEISPILCNSDVHYCANI